MLVRLDKYETAGEENLSAWRQSPNHDWALRGVHGKGGGDQSIEDAAQSES